MIHRSRSPAGIAPRQIRCRVRQTDPGIFVVIQPGTRSSALEHGISHQISEGVISGWAKSPDWMTGLRCPPSPKSLGEVDQTIESRRNCGVSMKKSTSAPRYQPAMQIAPRFAVPHYRPQTIDEKMRYWRNENFGIKLTNWTKPHPCE